MAGLSVKGPCSPSMRQDLLFYWRRRWELSGCSRRNGSCKHKCARGGCFKNRQSLALASEPSPAVSTGALHSSASRRSPGKKKKKEVTPPPAPFKNLINRGYGQKLIGASLSFFEGLNICTSGSATSCEECLLIHPKCAWCSKEVCGRGRGGVL